MTQYDLNLHQIRLPATAECPLAPDRLTFVLPLNRIGQFVSGQKTHRFSPGDVMVVRAPGAGKISALRDGELSFAAFSVGLEKLYPLFAGQEIARLQPMVEDFKEARVYAAAHPVAVECHRLVREVTAPVDLRHRSKLLHIAAVILSADFELTHRQRPGFDRQEQHLLQVFERLSGTEILELPLDAFAARFGCSRRHLNRLFHECFGCAVTALRMELRLLKAASRLGQPDAKVIQVAADCGFNHLGMFNTCFKRRFGDSPGQWRRTKASRRNQSPAWLGNGSMCALRSDGRCTLESCLGKPGRSLDELHPLGVVG